MVKTGRLAAAIVAAVAVGATLAACSGTSSATTSASSTAAAGASEPLVIYSAQGYDQATVDAFTKATGIQVKLSNDSTGPLLTKVQTEGKNPQWGLLWVDGDTAFSSLDQQGLLQSYASPALSNMTAAGKALLPSNNAYTPVSTTVVPAIVYNAAKAGSNVPTTYADLLTAAYKGQLGMNDPTQSGPTYPLIAGVMNQMGGQASGVQGGEDYFSKLKANGLQVFPTNGDTLHALENGQITYGLIQSSAATGEVASAKTSPTFQPKVAYLPKSTLLPGVMGISKYADAVQQSEAKQFIDFALSTAGQAAMQSGDTTGDSLFWPIVTGVQPIAPLPALPSDFQRIDPTFWGPLQSQVNSWFTANIK